MAVKPWRMAKSLEVLLKQVNERWPGRSKLSDGGKGDDKHAARASDHNPNEAGVVTARDFTHDLKHGLDARALAEALVASKDPRIKYIISNAEICSGTGANHPAWKWRPYTGLNAHRKHVHISVKAEKALYDSTAPWKLDSKAKPKKPVPVVTVAVIEAKPAPTPVPVSDEEMIKRVQTGLMLLKYNPGGADGLMGPLTKGAILSFRSDHDLPPGDFIDEELIKAIGTAKPRVMVPARANATSAEVSAAVPEVKTNALAKVGAAIVAIPSAAVSVGVGSLEYLGVAKSYIEPVQEAAGDVPGTVWIGLIALIAAGLFFWSRHGEQKGVEAYKSGDRR